MQRFAMTSSLASLTLCAVAGAQTAAVPVMKVDWNHLIATTRTTITLQVVENPPLRRGSAIHDAAWSNLAALQTDMTRLALWYPYPRLAVAELKLPTKSATFWDFEAIDPIVEDFFRATEHHTRVFTMSTIPSWMFLRGDPGPIPAAPDEAMWNYEAGGALRDPTGKEAANYFARVAAWYTAGGFRDERSVFQSSAHHERIDWWEVLNEPEYEHALDIKTYTKLYDRVTAAVHAVTPATKFMGMSLAEPMRSPASFEYFLNPAHHRPGTPLDAISYHFYADAEPGETDAAQEYMFFAQADAFLNSVRYIETIRKRLSPRTQTDVNETGCIAADDLTQGAAHTGTLLSAHYWSLCGAMFAYLYAGLAAQGIDVVGASQLLGYPSQFPSVSLLDWSTGAPNARYRVLQLLRSNFGPGDRIATSSLQSHDVFAAAYISPRGSRKILLINKRSHEATIRVTGAAGQIAQFSDLEGVDGQLGKHRLEADSIYLGPFAVMVVEFDGQKSRLGDNQVCLAKKSSGHE